MMQKIVANTITELAKSPIKNIIVDDLNYISQDYYMKKCFKRWMGYA